MLVQLLTSISGPWKFGDILDMDNVSAHRLIAGGGGKALTDAEADVAILRGAKRWDYERETRPIYERAERDRIDRDREIEERLRQAEAR